jgi:hypothetical protein
MPVVREPAAIAMISSTAASTPTEYVPSSRMWLVCTALDPSVAAATRIRSVISSVAA